MRFCPAATRRARSSRRTNLPAAAHQVFVGRQLGGADRSARRQSLGRDADLRTHAELAAVGELGRGVDQHDGAVDLAQEALGHGVILGHDRIGVVRAEALDMGDRLLDAVDDTNGEDRVEVFGAPVLLGCRRDLAVECQNLGIAAQIAARGAQIGEDRRQDRRRDLAVDQQGLGGPADRHPAHLGVEHDRPCLHGVGRAVDIGVAEPFEVGDHRYPALALNPLDQGRPAARHDNIDHTAHHEDQPDRRTVARRHQLDRILGQPAAAQPRSQSSGQRARRVKALRAAAQDRGIAGFECQPAGIGGDVGPALINDADDAERDGDPLDREPVRPGLVLPAAHCSSGLAQCRDLGFGGGECKRGRRQTGTTPDFGHRRCQIRL